MDNCYCLIVDIDVNCISDEICYLYEFSGILLDKSLDVVDSINFTVDTLDRDFDDATFITQIDALQALNQWVLSKTKGDKCIISGWRGYPKMEILKKIYKANNVGWIFEEVAFDIWSVFFFKYIIGEEDKYPTSLFAVSSGNNTIERTYNVLKNMS